MNNVLQKNTLWLNLLNSDWHDFRGSGKHEDRLYQDAWLIDFLTRWPGALKFAPLPEIRSKLIELRALLRRLADDFSKRKPLRKTDLESLNRILADSPEIRKISLSGQTYNLRYETMTPGMRSLFAAIASSVAEILAGGEPERIKVCQNPDCLWIFYDTSKNRSRKWCENATGCGNLMKVRSFRAKAKQKK